jgi:hypothetical protein
MIQSIDLWKRLKPSARYNILMRYHPRAIRQNGETTELIIRNQTKAQVWVPIDYCMRGEFTVEQLEGIKDRIEA